MADIIKSGQKGEMIICCRDDNFVFLKYLGKGDMDGGYTTWDRFEDLPKEWLYDSRFGYLCPECAKEFKIFVNKFCRKRLKYLIMVDPAGIEPATSCFTRQCLQGF